MSLNSNFDIKEKNLSIVLIILVIIVIIYGILFKYLGVDENNIQMRLFKLGLLGLFTFLILVNGLKYFFDFDIAHSKNRTDVKVIEKDIKKNPNVTSKEVFHIGDNVYTFDEAKLICNAYDGDLANYSQVENAYRNGAEWCSYGWSKGQMALYPTQKLTYEKLKKIPGLENSCGRPGINGGYIKNPNVRFGVNCFAVKGQPSTKERQEMHSNRTLSIPKTENNKKIDFYKRNLKKIIKRPFNKNKWSFF